MLEVIDPGLRATVQDDGRPGLGHLGVSRAGAADPLALAGANLLCGNAAGAAAVEMTLVGGTFRVLAPCLVAVCGADMDARVVDDGRSLRPGSAHRLRAGCTLAFGPAVDGARTILALQGGIDVPVVLGSRSTDPVGGFGGLAGRLLAPGDRLVPLDPGSDGPGEGRPWPGPGPSSGVVPGDGVRRVALLPGPHRGLIGKEAEAALLATDWQVSARSDRAGLRLQGPALPGSRPEQRVSLPMVPGAVQLPPAGLPIILGVDGPSVGGYPLIGVVPLADLPLVGQLRPGDVVRFAPITADEALALLRRREAELTAAARLMGRA